MPAKLAEVMREEDPNEILTAPGAIEALVKSGRYPFASVAYIGSNREPQLKFNVAPEGTQPGDSYQYSSGVMRFFSPTGEERGLATQHFFPVKEGRKLEERIREVMISEGLMNKSGSLVKALRDTGLFAEETLDKLDGVEDFIRKLRTRISDTML